MHRNLKFLLALVAVIGLCASLILWSSVQGKTKDLLGAGATVTVPATVVVPTTVSDHSSITIAAMGDVFSQTPIVQSAYNAKTNSYDFTRILAPVAPYLAAANYTIASLETRLVGQSAGYSNYPLYNSPDRLAAALKNAGVDSVATANSHSLDYGAGGISKTLDALDRAGLKHMGTYRSTGERESPNVVSIGGINVGFLNYTTKIDASAGLAKQGMVNVYTSQRAKSDVTSLRRGGAEVILAFVNYGSPFAHDPTEEESTISDQLLSYGVDLVMGSGLHMVQPITHVLDYSDSGVTSKYIAYSLGNFLSSERWRYADSGIVAYVQIRRDGEKVTVTGIKYLPVYVQMKESKGKKNYRVLPVLPGLEPTTDLAISTDDKERMSRVWEELRLLLYSPNEGITTLDPSEFGL